MGFDEAFTEVIGLEGSYSNVGDDPGGETKWGISKRSFPEADIANLTLEQAKQIYLEHYWNQYGLALVYSEPVATEIFEQAVNMGKVQAALHLQQALVMLGQPVYVDGVIGQQTIAATNRANQADLLRVLNGLQFMKYWQIAKDNPSQKKFFRGWLRRVA